MMQIFLHKSIFRRISYRCKTSPLALAIYQRAYSIKPNSRVLVDMTNLVPISAVWWRECALSPFSLSLSFSISQFCASSSFSWFMTLFFTGFQPLDIVWNLFLPNREAITPVFSQSDILRLSMDLFLSFHCRPFQL